MGTRAKRAVGVVPPGRPLPAPVAVGTGATAGTVDAGRDIMTAEEVAAYLHISRTYVFTLIKQDRLPHIRLGRRLLFRRDTLDRYLQERETTPVRR